jgi:BCD family chlorophyll transporter-like MFS transporter
LIGFKSDHHRSAFGWRRVPYVWLGTLLQFGGLAIMPFALLVLSMPHPPVPYVGAAAAGMAFLLVGAGLQTTQTAGLALACDLAPEAARPRVVALMYVALMCSMVVCGLVFGLFLAEFREIRLIQVIQGAALSTAILNVVAVWKMEPRNRDRAEQLRQQATPDFVEAWRSFVSDRRAKRFLVALGLGTAAFMMQDIVLEPYGGQILGMSVGTTSSLTAIFAAGALIAFAGAARLLSKGYDALVVASFGVVLGLPAFAAVSLAAPLESGLIFRAGVFVIGFGGGLFSVGTLTAAMSLEDKGRTGLALGAWGAVTATAGGLALASGGIIRDGVMALVGVDRAQHLFVGYGAVYFIEICLLVATLVAIGPLVRHALRPPAADQPKFGLADLPA